MNALKTHSLAAEIEDGHHITMWEGFERQKLLNNEGNILSYKSFLSNSINDVES